MLKTILILPFLSFFACLYFVSRSGLEEYRAAMKEYGFSLPRLAPMGFYIYRLMPPRLNSPRNRKIMTLLGQLFVYREAHIYFMVHTAQKYVFILVILFLTGIVYLAVDAGGAFLAAGFTVAGLSFYKADQDLERKIEDKKRDMLIDLPVFINNLTLLLNAGLPFFSAFQESSAGHGPLYRELGTTLSEIKGGKSMSQAYEDLSQRCRVPEITRFVSAVLQNLNRGNSDMVYVLRSLSRECWQRRKDIAKKKGEEASSKLVFPMVMIFVAVSIIVLAPALMVMGR
ncbi:MAG: type II secretion system F family protein [Bacillota bacterium]